MSEEKGIVAAQPEAKKIDYTPHANGLAPKARTLETEVANEHVGREEEIRAAMLALLSRSHAVFIGEPGIAKSSVIRRICIRILGAVYFYKLMFGDMPASSLFGQFSLKALEMYDKHMRNVQGFLPTCHLAFLDELWRASAQCLDGLNDVVNERQFANGDQVHKCPLVSMFAASNDYPLDDAMRALWDRFLLRVHVEELKSKSQQKKLLQLPELLPNPKPVLTMDELGIIHGEVENVTVPDAVQNNLLDLFANMLACDPPIQVSDRRKRLSLRVLKAAAWLSGRDRVSTKDLGALEHVLWVKREEIKPIKVMLEEYKCVTEDVVREAMKGVREIARNLRIAQAENSGGVQDLSNLVVDALTKGKIALAALNEASKRADGHEDVQVITTACDEVRGLVTEWDNMLDMTDIELNGLAEDGMNGDS